MVSKLFFTLGGISVAVALLISTMGRPSAAVEKPRCQQREDRVLLASRYTQATRELACFYGHKVKARNRR